MHKGGREQHLEGDVPGLERAAAVVTSVQPSKGFEDPLNTHLVQLQPPKHHIFKTQGLFTEQDAYWMIDKGAVHA